MYTAVYSSFVCMYIQGMHDNIIFIYDAKEFLLNSEINRLYGYYL